MTGKITHLYLKVAHGQPMKPITTTQIHAQKGFVGDVSYGRAKRQVLFIEQETLSEFNLNSGDTRENITTSGIKLAGLAAGTKLAVGEARFEVTGDCAPCSYMDGFEDGLQDRIRGRRGTLCRALTDGTIQVGDTIKIEE